ncbi:MAG TPA: HAMP domain-containing sensor histidine kinase [Phenylobacterium sp.]|nr:HAMP domain-containing sensor histidine kinase [Phenylobacterium sp.]
MSPASDIAEAEAEGRAREISRWHLAWLMAGAAMATLALALGQDRWTLTAVALGVIGPAVAGGVLAARPDRGGWLLSAWAAGGALAALLTGGLVGPLAALSLTPLAAGLALAERRRLRLAAVLSLAVLGVLALARSAGIAADPALADWRLGLFAWLATLGGLGWGLKLAWPRPVAVDPADLRLARLLAAQPFCYLALTAAGRVTATFGEPPRGIRAASLTELGLTWIGGPAETRTRIEQALEETHTTGEAEIAFEPAGDPDGWVSLHLRRAGEDRILGVLRDASAEARRIAAAEAARDAAEARDSGKSRFLANMSHELRTPLNAIMGFSDVMRARLFGPLPERYAEYAELIHESGRHLLDLINDILDMSKIEADRYELALEDFDAAEAVTSVLRLARVQADQNGVQLRGVLPREPLEVTADRRALKQMVLNLVGNALKFTPKGGSVTVTAGIAGGMLEVAVADTGVGIAAKDLGRLGRPYEQAGDADQKAAGTGLGLSLVRALAQLHGGDLHLESALGEGTVATIRLPAQEAKAAA